MKEQEPEIKFLAHTYDKYRKKKIGLAPSPAAESGRISTSCTEPGADHEQSYACMTMDARHRHRPRSPVTMTLPPRREPAVVNLPGITEDWGMGSGCSIVAHPKPWGCSLASRRESKTE
jgi:hypothetical protein